MTVVEGVKEVFAWIYLGADGFNAKLLDAYQVGNSFERKQLLEVFTGLIRAMMNYEAAFDKEAFFSTHGLSPQRMTNTSPATDEPKRQRGRPKTYGL